MTIRATQGRGRLYDSIVDTVGDTPCIHLNRDGVAETMTDEEIALSRPTPGYQIN
ncbi:hypothetical protein NOR53_3432 [gamma proteobacterium NOR5-3]|nr:hypothetical protein NOR53_3432 [gamma proteobacterium NOR5-3]